MCQRPRRAALLIAVDTWRRGAHKRGGGCAWACGCCRRSHSLPRVLRCRRMGAERPAARFRLVSLPPVRAVVERPLGSCMSSLDSQFIPDASHLPRSLRTRSAISLGPAVGSALVDVTLLGHTKRSRHACIRSEAQIDGGSMLRILAHHVPPRGRCPPALRTRPLCRERACAPACCPCPAGQGRDPRGSPEAPPERSPQIRRCFRTEA